MQLAQSWRSRFLWTGVGLGSLQLVATALYFTAVPVILDLPLVSLAIAVLAIPLLVLALWRDLKGPGSRTFGFKLGTIALIVSLGVVALSVDLTVLSYRAREIHFRNDGVELAGTVYTPRSDGAHPAIVMVHGSGPETRSEYAFFAQMFARHDFVGLAYDKRGSGRSTGKLYESDYRDYALDALAAVRYLKQSEDVIPGCIGLMGFSEGEWVASLAASQSSDIAFLVIVAPSGVSPAEQVNQEIALRLRDHGYPEETLTHALALNDRVFGYQRTGQADEALQRDLLEAQREPWFRDAHDIPGELYPAEEYKWWRSVMDFDPTPIWTQVKVPVLLLKGGRDPNSDAAVAKKEIESALAKGGNHATQFIVFPKGDHSLLEWPLGRHVPPPVFVDGYLETVKNWVGQQACARR